MKTDLKLDHCSGLPSPRRVTIYLAEKGLDVTLVNVDIAAGDQHRPEFRRKNPAGKVPVLELEDGSCLTESAAIMEYLEERFPHPPMLGTTPLERARTRATERLVGEITVRSALTVMHTHPAMRKLRPQIVPCANMAPALQPGLDAFIDTLERQIGTQPFLCGERPTIPDCVLFAHFDFMRRFDHELPLQSVRLRDWFQRFSQRESASAP